MSRAQSCCCFNLATSCSSQDLEWKGGLRCSEWVEEALDEEGGGVSVLEVLVITGFGLWGSLVGVIVDWRFDKLGGGLILGGARGGEDGLDWRFSKCSKMHESIFSLCFFDLFFFLLRISKSVSEVDWDKMVTSSSTSVISFLIKREGRRGRGGAPNAFDVVGPDSFDSFGCDEVVSANKWPGLGRMVIWLGPGLGERFVRGLFGFLPWSQVRQLVLP